MADVKFFTVFLLVLFIMSADINNRVRVDGQVTCCNNNHIGRCVPGEDDIKCDTMCKQYLCTGGFCKVYSYKAPNHFCHCYCNK
ncbi:hypothetical protein ABFS83_02G104800 [Erythranthe nasuta]